MNNNQISSVAQGILQPSEGFTIDLESPEWLTWLETAKSFHYHPKSQSQGFTARREGNFWYGYRKVKGKLHKRYIGNSQSLTVAKLEEIAVLLETPNSPRPKGAKRKKPLVTDKLEYVTKQEIQQLYQEVAALRDEMRMAVGK